MAIKEKRVLAEVTICDYCDAEILDNTSTHITAKAEGYIKKSNFEFDMCADCAQKIGLRRRGRRPAETTAVTSLPRTGTDDW